MQSAPQLIDEVMLQPVQPRPAPAYIPPQQQAPEPVMQSAPAPYIPPVAEQPLRAQRMPRVEDLPLPGQRQIHAQRNDAPSAADAKRRTLFERLASFGMGRDNEPHAPQGQPGPLVAPVRPVPAPVQVQPQQRQQPAPSPVHAEFAKRPAAPVRAQQPQLDLHGRPMTQQRNIEEDQIDIPAFLRRQSN